MAEEHAIILRAEAKARGLKRYFNGKPCPRGHLVERSTCSGGCIKCRDEYHQVHPNKIQESRLRWLERNPELLKELRESWRRKNPDKQRASAARWAAANRDRVLERGRRWAKRHPEVVAAKTNRRRTRKIAAGGSHTASDLRSILRMQNYKCVYCFKGLKTAKRHADHITPLSAGGSNDKGNIQWLCAPCNLAKSAKDPLKFAQELGLLL